MEYNWADPKKNSRVKSFMMAKTELSRKKRLTNVKSTVSNQLHPTIEKKLRKKKKSPESARQCIDSDEDDLGHGRNNNDIHEHPNLGGSRGDRSKNARQDVYSSSSSSSKKSMFEDFGSNAAAEGLFHPASTIAAFIEHDAKYRQEISQNVDQRSGSRFAGLTTQSEEYPPSREAQKLPVLLSGNAQRDRLSSRSESRLRGSKDHRSAPSSAASSITLLDTGAITSTRSDSDLHAPRRSGTIPSSADSNALDFFDNDEESDEDILNQSRNATTRFENVNIECTTSDFSITKKFEELKQIMKANRDKKAVNGQETDEKMQTHAASSETKTRIATDNDTNQKKLSKNVQSLNSKTTNGSTTTTKKKGSEKATVTSSDTSAIKQSSSGEASIDHGKSSKSRSSIVSSSGKIPIASVVPLIRSKKEMKIRNGMSLSDLKEEHRVAMEMLKELGGPVDADYQNHGEENLHVTAKLSFARSSKRVGRGVRGTTNMKQSEPHANNSRTVGSANNEGHKHSSSPISNGAAGSLVAKLRASIPSSREKLSELTPEVLSPELSMERESMEDNNSATSDSHASQCQPVQSEEDVERDEMNSFNGAIQMNDALGNGNDQNDNMYSFTTDESHDHPESKQAEYPTWKQYEEEDEDSEEENNDDDEDDVEKINSPPITTRSIDLYGDDGFESEW